MCACRGLHLQHAWREQTLFFFLRGGCWPPGIRRRDQLPDRVHPNHQATVPIRSPGFNSRWVHFLPVPPESRLLLLFELKAHLEVPTSHWAKKSLPSLGKKSSWPRQDGWFNGLVSREPRSRNTNKGPSIRL